MMSKLFAALALFGCILLGCSPTAPSVSSGPPVANWNHLQSEIWQYELQHSTRILRYRFHPNGAVFATEGRKQGDIHEIAAIVYHWYLDDDGYLTLTDENRMNTYRTLAVVTLTTDSANLRDLATGETDLFRRTFTD